MRWVVFDLGGVVVRVANSWRECAQRAQISFQDRLGLEEPVIQFRSLREFQAGRIDDKAYFAELGKYLGCSPSEAELAHQAVLIGEYEGLFELSSEIRDHGAMQSCLSNTNEPHVEVMLSDPRFRTVAGFEKHLFSHRVRLEKPNSDIYEWACQSLPASPDQIVFFDDSEPNVDTARRLGWAAHLVRPEDEPAAQIRSALRQEGLPVSGIKN